MADPMTRPPRPTNPPDEGGPYRRLVPETARPIHRSVPLLLRLRVLFERRRTQVSLLLAAFLAITLWGGAPHVDWALVGFDGPTDRYPGEVLGMERMGEGTRHHGPSYRVRFRYEHDDQVFTGTSIAGNHQLQEGYKVYVEVPRGHDEYAVVVGLRSGAMPHQLFFVMALLTLGVLGYAAATLIARRRVLRLLAHGRVSEGRLTSITTGWWHSARDPVWDLRAVYEDHFGRTHGVMQSTLDLHHTSHGGPASVAYDPDVPTRAVILDVLPGAPSIDGDEVRFEASAWRLFLALAPPALFVIANLAGVLIAVR
jgi:hypothetical protein